MRHLCLLLIALCTLTSTQAQQQTTLKLNLEKGKTYKQATETTSQIVQQISGQEFVMNMTIAGSMAYLVKEVKENDYTLEVKYENLSMAIELPQASVEFSSDKDDKEDILSTILAEMIHKPFHIIMTKTGKVTQVNGIEAMFENSFKRFSELSEAQTSQIKAQLMQAYGEKAFKGSIEMVTAVYPQKPVSLNDTWEVNTKIESGMAADMNTTYKYAESNANYNLIQGESTIATADKDAYITINGKSTKYDLTGTMSSTVKVDKTSGWIIEANVKQTIQGDAYIKLGGTEEEATKIPITMSTKMNYTDK